MMMASQFGDHATKLLNKIKEIKKKKNPNPNPKNIALLLVFRQAGRYFKSFGNACRLGGAPNLAHHWGTWPSSSSLLFLFAVPSPSSRRNIKKKRPHIQRTALTY